jgi:hypothetical protein
MNRSGGSSALRLCAMAICAVFSVALIPAALMCYSGLGWLDLEGLPRLSAAAMVCMPLPVGGGAYFAWTASRAKRGGPLLGSVACLLAAGLLCAVIWAWGGRMLL